MTRTSGSIGGASGDRRQRTVRESANSFYVVAKNRFGTAWAHHFTRNSGGSDSTDTGGSWPIWRYVGTKELAAYGDNPVSATPLFTYSDDTGAQDYAIAAPSGQFLGSYHGGDVISRQVMTMDGQAVDPSLADVEGRQFTIEHISAPVNSGNSYSIELRVTVQAKDGNLAFAVPQLSSSITTFTKPFIGMVIGSGPDWDELHVQLYGGSATIPVPVPVGTTWTANAWHAAMRQSGTGRVIRVKGNHPQHGFFRRTRTVRAAARTKFYFELTGSVALSGRYNMAWTVEFEKGGTTGVQASLPANLVANGDFTTDLTGWTTTHTATGGSVAQSGGKARFTRGTANDSRIVQAVAGLTVGGVYLLNGEETTSAGAQGQMGLTSAANGSTSSPTPAYAPDSDDANGYNARLMLATLTTHYVMLKQDAGTSGQTTDFDNVGLYRLAAAA